MCIHICICVHSCVFVCKYLCVSIWRCFNTLALLCSHLIFISMCTSWYFTVCLCCMCVNMCCKGVCVSVCVCVCVCVCVPRLYNNRISSAGCASLSSALRENPQPLIELDLSGNEPGEEGVELLSSIIRDK